MVKNDFDRDLERLLDRRGRLKADLARELGTERSRVNLYVRKAGVNKGYVDYVEALGYDIVIVYVEGEEGVLNDFRADIDRLIEETGYRKSDIAKDMGVGLSELRSFVRYAGVTRGYVSLCTLLGYGLRFEYISYMK